jgi:hypothetical protein
MDWGRKGSLDQFSMPCRPCGFSPAFRVSASSYVQSCASFVHVLTISIVFDCVLCSSRCIQGRNSRVNGGIIHDLSRIEQGRAGATAPVFIPNQGRRIEGYPFLAFPQPGQPISNHQCAFLCWVCAVLWAIAALIILLAVFVR